jgi:hypothetical protein
MTTDPRQERTLGQLVASATQDISTLIRSEIALAKAEIAVQAKKAGVGGGLLAAAAVIVFYSVYFLFITIAEGLKALGLPSWAAYLIVFVFMLLVAAVLAWLGVRKMKSVNPTPEKAIASTQQTIEGLKAATENPGTVVPAPRPPWDQPELPQAPAPSGVSAEPAAPTTPDPTRDA